MSYREWIVYENWLPVCLCLRSQISIGEQLDGSDN